MICWFWMPFDTKLVFNVHQQTMLKHIWLNTTMAYLFKAFKIETVIYSIYLYINDMVYNINKLLLSHICIWMPTYTDICLFIYVCAIKSCCYIWIILLVLGIQI